jgi:hypothetical protein
VSRFPIRPHLKSYRGSKDNLRRRAAEYNAKANKIAEHLNTLAANNPAEIQQYMFVYIARDLGFTTEEVRSAISDGGSNGITLGVREDDRRALATYKR